MIYFPSDFSTEPACPPRLLAALEHLRASSAKCAVGDRPWSAHRGRHAVVLRPGCTAGDTDQISPLAQVRYVGNISLPRPPPHLRSAGSSPCLQPSAVQRRHSCTYSLHTHCWPTPLFTTAVARAHSCAHSCTTHRRCIFLWLQLLAQLSTVQLSDGVEWHSCHGVRRGRHCWI